MARWRRLAAMRSPALAIPLLLLFALTPSAAATCALWFCAEPDAGGSGVETASGCFGLAATLCVERGVGGNGWDGCGSDSWQTRNTYVIVATPAVAAVVGVYETCTTEDDGGLSAWNVYANHADGTNDVHQAGVVWYEYYGSCTFVRYSFRHPVFGETWAPGPCPAGLAPPVLP